MAAPLAADRRPCCRLGWPRCPAGVPTCAALWSGCIVARWRCRRSIAAAGAAGVASRPAGLIDGARRPGGRGAARLVVRLRLHLVGLYWITEAILIEAARFWWFVPIAVPALAAMLAVFIAAAAGRGAVGARRLAARLALAGAWVLADLARQFIATGFPWNRGQRLGVSGLARRRVHPAGGAGQRARPDLGHRAAGGDAGAGLALARRPASGCWSPGRRSASSACTSRCRRQPGAARGAGAGQRRGGPEMGPRAGDRDLRALPAADPGGMARGRTGARRGGLAGDRQPSCCNRMRWRARRSREAAEGAPALVGAVRFDTDSGRATACLR